MPDPEPELTNGEILFLIVAEADQENDYVELTKLKKEQRQVWESIANAFLQQLAEIHNVVLNAGRA